MRSRICRYDLEVIFCEVKVINYDLKYIKRYVVGRILPLSVSKLVSCNRQIDVLEQAKWCPSRGKLVSFKRQIGVLQEANWCPSRGKLVSFKRQISIL